MEVRNQDLQLRQLHLTDSPSHWTINFLEISDGVYQCVAAGAHFFQSATKVILVDTRRQQTQTEAPTAVAVFPGSGLGAGRGNYGYRVYWKRGGQVLKTALKETNTYNAGICAKNWQFFDNFSGFLG